MVNRKCEAQFCHAAENLLRDLTGYFHCAATTGDALFYECKDNCLARILLAELGYPVATLAELRDRLPLSAVASTADNSREISNEGHTGFVWSE